MAPMTICSDLFDSGNSIVLNEELMYPPGLCPNGQLPGGYFWVASLSTSLTPGQAGPDGIEGLYSATTSFTEGTTTLQTSTTVIQSDYSTSFVCEPECSTCTFNANYGVLPAE
jgi:hypothetical protein